jgi:hypothetical protein
MGLAGVGWEWFVCGLWVGSGVDGSGWAWTRGREGVCLRGDGEARGGVGVRGGGLLRWLEERCCWMLREVGRVDGGRVRVWEK